MAKYDVLFFPEKHVKQQLKKYDYQKYVEVKSKKKQGMPSANPKYVNK